MQKYLKILEENGSMLSREDITIDVNILSQMTFKDLIQIISIS